MLTYCYLCIRAIFSSGSVFSDQLREFRINDCANCDKRIIYLVDWVIFVKIKLKKTARQLVKVHQLSECFMVLHKNQVALSLLLKTVPFI